MPLTEAEIQRYARHVLLPEVGGVGQEKLLAADVRIRGVAELVELASDYLRAAGVQVDAHSGPALTIELRGGPRRSLSVDGDSIVIDGGEPNGQPDFESGAIAACLAASEILRLILGLGEPERRWRVRGATVERLP